jgi:hypothetical protein
MTAARRQVIDLAAEIRGELGPDARTTTAAAANNAPVVSPGSLPTPYAASDGELGNPERADLATCEAALDNLRVAFWAAGKALQVIRDARLYRDTHATFEDYVELKWDMSRAQAYRLIDAWPLAESLSPIGDKLNESQIRELLPLADRHGRDAAVTVYRTVAEADGSHVTAALLRRVVSILPGDGFEHAAATAQIRAYLADGLPPAARPVASPAEAFTAEAAKLVRVLHRVADREMIQAAQAADPDAVKRMIADVRALLDEIEHEGGDQNG